MLKKLFIPLIIAITCNSVNASESNEILTSNNKQGKSQDNKEWLKYKMQKEQQDEDDNWIANMKDDENYNECEVEVDLLSSRLLYLLNAYEDFMSTTNENGEKLKKLRERLCPIDGSLLYRKHMLFDVLNDAIEYTEQKEALSLSCSSLTVWRNYPRNEYDYTDKFSNFEQLIQVIKDKVCKGYYHCFAKTRFHANLYDYLNNIPLPYAYRGEFFGSETFYEAFMAILFKYTHDEILEYLKNHSKFNIAYYGDYRPLQENLMKVLKNVSNSINSNIVFETRKAKDEESKPDIAYEEKETILNSNSYYLQKEKAIKNGLEEKEITRAEKTYLYCKLKDKISVK